MPHDGVSRCRPSCAIYHASLHANAAAKPLRNTRAVGEVREAQARPRSLKRLTADSPATCDIAGGHRPPLHSRDLLKIDRMRMSGRQFCALISAAQAFEQTIFATPRNREGSPIAP